MSSGKTVYFHVGLGKTGSTFLQQEVFPKLDGIHYVGPQQYKKVARIVSQSRQSKILVSREFDKQLEEELRSFCEQISNVKVIVCFRRQDEWMASQYRRRVKNGWLMSFHEFIDVEQNTGYWKAEELYYQPKVELIRSITGNDPLVLVYDELRDDPQAYLKRISDFIGIKLPQNISFKPRHRSFSDKQLIVLQTFCRKFVRSVPRGRSNKLMHWLLYRPVWAFYHIVLYAAKFIPWSLISRKELIISDELEAVKRFFEEDWEWVKKLK